MPLPLPEATIACPKCQTDIPLSEALTQRLRQSIQADLTRDIERQKRELEEQAAALRLREEKSEQRIQEELAARESAMREKARAAAQREFEQRIAESNEELDAAREKIAAMQQNESELRRRARELEDKEKELELNIERKIEAERARIAEEARRRALKETEDARAGAEAQMAELRERLSRAETEHKAELDRARRREREALDLELQDLKARAAESDAKMQSAREREIELLRKTRELEEQKKEADLEIARRIDQERAKLSEEAERRAAEQFRNQLAQRDHQLEMMNKQIEDLRRKGEQGSQQLQGEALETQFEQNLRQAFPGDKIDPVGKGKTGADLIQRVISPMGADCGAIVWECKQTKNWGKDWIDKVKNDMRAAKGTLAVIVSATLPPDVRTFDYKDGVFVTTFECALPLARALRLSLEQIAAASSASVGRAEKMEMLYRYLSGPEFSQRMQAIIEAFRVMQRDLDAEKAAFAKLWAKREKQIARVIENTSGMYGDFQGIMGAGGPPELEGLSLKALTETESERGSEVVDQY